MTKYNLHRKYNIFEIRKLGYERAQRNIKAKKTVIPIDNLDNEKAVDLQEIVKVVSIVRGHNKVEKKGDDKVFIGLIEMIERVENESGENEKN